MMLTLENLILGYESITICRDVDLTIEEGDAICLLGRNGMGKTTLLEGIMGMNTRQGGKIWLNGEDLSRKPTHQRAMAGLGLVPQGRRIFADISVRNNLRLGTLARSPNDSGEDISAVIFDFFPILYDRLDQKANTLSGGEQQMLAIGRALAGKPKLLLLDEPSEGLAPLIVDAIARLLTYLIEEQGLAVLLAEQNLAFALEVAQRGYVIEKGQIVAAGGVEDLRDNEIVRKYLMV